MYRIKNNDFNVDPLQRTTFHFKNKDFIGPYYFKKMKDLLIEIIFWLGVNIPFTQYFTGSTPLLTLSGFWRVQY